MKKFTITFFSVALIIGAIVFALSSKGAGTTTASNSTLATGSTISSSSNKVYTLDQVAAHNSQSDCWLAIDGGVYDITSYMGQHPGGDGVMVQYCGKDASTAFATYGRGSGRGHSTMAYALLSDYKVGTV